MLRLELEDAVVGVCARLGVVVVVAVLRLVMLVVLLWWVWLPNVGRWTRSMAISSPLLVLLVVVVVD